MPHLKECSGGRVARAFQEYIGTYSDYRTVYAGFHFG